MVRGESIAFGVAGAFFGVLVGWMIGSQQTIVRSPAAVQTTAPPETTASSPAGDPTATRLDEARVAELRRVADENPRDATPRTQLGNLYFDAERYSEAIRWYEEVLRLDPNDVNVSTDLGVSYYYTNQPDRALAQFDLSLRIDGRHIKTMLNVGIVRAFGKQDLDGAITTWRQVVELSPDSPEGRAAQQAIDTIAGAHPATGTNQ